MHPNVELMESYEDIWKADFILFLPGTSPWHLTECSNISFSSKIVVLDEFDLHITFKPRKTAQEMVDQYGPEMMWYFMYFKRSFVSRLDGRFLRYPYLHSKAQQDVYPLAYAISESYIPSLFTFQREVEILCTLRGSASMTTRLRVSNWITEYAANRSVDNVITTQVRLHSLLVLFWLNLI